MHPLRIVSICVALLSLAAGAGADAPAMLPGGGTQETRADLSFASFAKDWISRELVRGERASRAPRAQTGSVGVVFTYRAIAPEFETELRPTGRPASPFIGVVHYKELTYTCTDVKGSHCTRTAALPLAEVFRWRGGRWGY